MANCQLAAKVAVDPISRCRASTESPVSSRALRTAAVWATRRRNRSVSAACSRDAADAASPDHHGLLEHPSSSSCRPVRAVVAAVMPFAAATTDTVAQSRTCP